MVKDLTNLEEPFTLENKTNEVVAIRYYLVNFVEKLQPGDKIEITPKSSEELAYYMKIQEDLETDEGSSELTAEDYVIKTLEFLQIDTKQVRIPNPGRIEEDFVVGFDIGNESIPEASYTKYTYNIEVPAPNGDTVELDMEVYINSDIAVSLTSTGNGTQKIKFENGNITNEYYEQNSN